MYPNVFFEVVLELEGLRTRRALKLAQIRGLVVADHVTL